ncbi:MAG: Holliday junction resolvase RuvX [Flavobacteriales bacterium]|nr:Holliday junction resolvase RuvX [Crocinitomicaceae bacterium]NBX80731.1 Holliday junction resolvase RuvX [Flavobacteriales bacterium]NCA20592.1 Holliday junction resolvase RuvX [Crocinitomicaceae bacterium]
MSKIIALDFGLKRTGIAITDEKQIIASPLTTVDSPQLMDFLKKLVLKEKIELFVLGFPLRLDGSDSHITENVRILKEVLEKEFPSIPVVFQDERYSSASAMETIHLMGKTKHKKDKKLVDRVAATIILSEYMRSIGK